MSKELKIRIVIMLVILFAFVVFMTWNEKYISKSNYSKENIDEIKISFEVIEENGKEISYTTYAGSITDKNLIQDIVEDLNKVYFIKEPQVIQDLTEYLSTSGRSICECTFTSGDEVVDYRVFNFASYHSTLLNSEREYIPVNHFEELENCMLKACEESEEIDKEVKTY